MRKLTKLSLAAALVVLTSAAGAQTIDNWRAADGTAWKNGTNELCWRNANWTPATAAPGCDGYITMQPLTQTTENFSTVGHDHVKAEEPKAAEPVKAQKVTYASDTFFDFDKAVLKPEAKTALDDLSSKIRAVNLEVVVATGHTDSIGAEDYNKKLSLKRAEAVKAYLVSKGVEGDRIYIQGKGESTPVATNANAAGRAKNRRVEIEVVGTTK